MTEKYSPDLTQPPAPAELGASPAVQDQPLATKTMVLDSSPVAPAGGRNGDHFSTGLFACKEPVEALMACFCPCIVYGENQQRYEALENHQAILPQELEPCGSAALLFCGIQCFTGVAFILNYFQRQALRRRYGISGTEVDDFVLSCFCLPCSLAQQQRELIIEGGGQHV